MADSRQKTLVVHGNCQAENIYEVLRHDPTIPTAYRVLYQAAMKGHPRTLSVEDLSSCDILIDMVMMSGDTLDYTLLSSGCRIVRLNSVFINALYPFFSPVNPYNVPRPPVAPWGPFPYGDTAILGMIEAGMAAADICAAYFDDWPRYAPDLDRLYRSDCARLSHIDRGSDVPIGDFLLETFRTRRLFYTPRHPTPTLFRELLARISIACASFEPLFARARLTTTLDMLLQTRPRGPLFSQLVPVHPRVAAHFSLGWYDPQDRFELPGRSTVSYRHFITAMIAEFIAVKTAREAEAERAPAC